MKTFYVKIKPEGITRRVIKISELPKTNLKQRKTPVSKKYQKGSKIDWGTSNVKLMFNYWNSKGWPFVKHRYSNSKTVVRAIKQLTHFSKKYETRELTDAMDRGHQMFSLKTFMFYNVYRNKKISLSDFLKYEPELLEIQNKGRKNKLPQSWMEVFLKPKEYAIKHYRRTPKEHAPYLTKSLINIWVRYKQHNVNVDDFDFKTKIVRFSNLLFNFSKMNKLQDVWVVERIDEAMNKFRTIKLPRLSYALGRGFWSETLPEELLRYQYHQFKSHNFQTNWGELNK